MLATIIMKNTVIKRTGVNMTMYVLITEEKTRVYHIKSCATIFQGIYGGTITEVNI